ncbi:hypothetical protein AGMMS49992_13590 [Clostridia bacterium]|nr:hypothetical protein AGMMS49992_13590 [Clostridia bacterium]
MNHGDGHATYRLRAIGGVDRAVLRTASGDAKLRLMGEYQTLRTVNLPSIPKALDFFEEDGSAYLLREYFEGVSLYEIVESRGVLSQDEAIGAITAICRIIHKLHEMQPPIIVNDVKPQNIIRLPDNTYAFVDFDAVTVGEAGFASAITPATAAPEQFGYQPSDPRTDVYGIGMVLLYMLTGGFRADPAHIRLAPRGMQGVLRRCLAFDPKRRYPSAEALAAALRRRGKSARLIQIVAAATFVLLAVTGLLIYNVKAAGVTARFTEPLIERAARVSLGLSDETRLTREALRSVDSIIICGDHSLTRWEDHHQYAQWHFVRDASGEATVDAEGEPLSLGDLRMMPNLHYLIIDMHPLADLTPLKGLPLERVSLCGDSIIDLTALSAASGITSLRIEDNHISSLEPLSRLTALAELDVSANPIESLTPIPAQSLERLIALNVTIRPTDTIAGMTRLRELRVTSIPSTTLESLSDAASLTLLALFNGQYDSFEPFAAIPNLRELSLGGALVSDLDSARLLTTVTALTVNNLAAADLSWLVPLTQLQSLGLEYAAINDMSALSNLPNLTDIYTDSRTARQIERDAPGLNAVVHISQYTE